MKTDILQEYGIDKSDIIFPKTTKGMKITLCARSSLSSSGEVTFKILGKYFEDFLASEINYWLEEIRHRVSLAGLSNTDNIKDIAKDVLMSAFESYLHKNDIEIICDIEREKSPFYENMYNGLQIHEVA